jgi:hypothetical protein
MVSSIMTRSRPIRLLLEGKEDQEEEEGEDVFILIKYRNSVEGEHLFSQQ